MGMDELDIYQKQGFGNQSGFGERPALLIVDFVNGFTDENQFGGGNIDAAIATTKSLLATARVAEIRWRSPAWSMPTMHRTPAYSA